MALAREQQHLADSEADMPRFRSCATASSICLRLLTTLD